MDHKNGHIQGKTTSFSWDMNFGNGMKNPWKFTIKLILFNSWDFHHHWNTIKNQLQSTLHFTGLFHGYFMGLTKRQEFSWTKTCSFDRILIFFSMEFSWCQIHEKPGGLIHAENGTKKHLKILWIYYEYIHRIFMDFYLIVFTAFHLCSLCS